MKVRVHVGARLRVAASTVALAAAIGGASAPPAHALLGLGGTSGSLTSGTTGLVGGLVGGTLDTVTGVACPLTSTLATTLARTPGLGDGLGAIGAGLTTLTCASGLLDHRFVTRYRRPDGTVVTRTHTAVLGVPTALNVDDEPTPDLTGTVSLTGTNTVGLRVSRTALRQSANLPVAVEAVLGDPSTKVLGRRHLAVGYDATADQAPGTLVLDTPLDTITRPGGDVRIDLSQVGRRSRVAITAGLFDGTPTARVEPTEARVDYGASPDSASIVARVGEQVSATLTTNRPGPTQLSGRVVDGARTDAVDASITDLPSSLTVAADTRDGVLATYGASARVGALRAELKRTEAGRLARKSVVALDDVPTGLTASVKDEAVSVTTTGGPIGLAQVASANGEPKTLPGEPAYVLSDDDGTIRSIAARVPGLERVTAAIGDAPRVAAQLKPTPLLARVRTPQRRLEARIADLPARFDLGLDLDDGRVTYDGFGRGIDRVELEADGSEPLVGRATKLKGAIAGIPASLDLELADQGEGQQLGVSASNPVGSVELVASDRAIAFRPGVDLPEAGRQGVRYTDRTGGAFLVGARILGLKALGAALGQGDAVRLTTETAGGPFDADVDTDQLTGRVALRDLPAKLAASLDLASGRLALEGQDAQGQDVGISELSADLRSPDGLVGRATDVVATVRDLPARLVLTLAQDGRDVRVEASEPIGSAEVVAANRRPQADDLPLGDEQGAKYVDTAEEFVVGARIRRFSRLSARTAGDQLAVGTKTAGGPFGVRVRTDALEALARVDDLPEELDATLDPSAGKLTLDGHGQGIERVTLDGHASRPVFGRITDLKARIERLAPLTVVDVAQDGEGAKVSANEPIGLVEVAAASRPIAAGDLPAGDEQGAVYTDLPAEFVVGARVRDLKAVAASLGDRLAIETQTAGGPFGVRARTADLEADLRIEDLPDRFKAAFDPEAQTLALDDSAPIGSIALDARSAAGRGLFGRAREVRARLTDVPAQLTVGLDGERSGARVSVPDGQALGALELLAGDEPGRAFPLSEQGVVLHDTPEEFLVAAKLQGLKGLDVGLDDAAGIGLDLRRTAGSRFVADVDVAGGLKARADVRDLPADTRLGVDLEGGEAADALTFRGRDEDGEPQGIDVLDLAAESDTPILGGGRYVQGHLERLPSDLALGFSQDEGRATVRAIDPRDPDGEGAPVGKVELAASDTAGEFAYPVDGAGQPAQGAILRSKPGEPFRVGVRVLELRRVSVDFEDAIELQTRTAGGPFVADVSTAAFGATAQILDLPEELDLALDPETGKVDYEGSAGIGRISAEVRGDQPLFLGATSVAVDLQRVPSAFSLGLARGVDPEDPEASDLRGIKLEANAPIGQVDVRAKSDGRAYPELPEGQAGALLDATGDELGLALRVFQLQLLDVGLDPLTLRTKMEGGRVFTVDAKLPQDGGGPDLEVRGTIDRLPGELALGLGDDPAGGSALSLKGSAPIGLVKLSTKGMELLDGADAVEAELEGLPQDVTVALPESGDLARIEARDAAGNATPIGQLRLAAGSGAAELPADTYDAATGTSAGDDLLRLKQVPGDFAVRGRLTGLKALGLALEPIALRASTVGGKRLDVEAEVARDAGAPLKATALVDRLPADVRLALGDTPQQLPSGEPNGSQLKLTGSSPIDLVTLDVEGLPLLEGADRVEAALHAIPEQLTVTIPEEGSLAQVAAANAAGAPTAVGQIRLAAGAGDPALPAYVDPASPVPATVTQSTASNDLLRFATTQGAADVGLRLSGVKGLDIDLDPITIGLTQDGRSRPITIDAALPNANGTSASVDGLLNRPGARTSLQVLVEPDQPTQIVFDNDVKLARLELNAQDLGAIPKVDLAMDNLSPRLRLCLDGGPACRLRTGNAFSASGGNNAGLNRPYPAMVSVDFDDFNTHAAGQLTRLNAKLRISPSDPEISITNMEFSNLAFDLGQGPTFSNSATAFQSIPRLYGFFDSRGKPFSIDTIVYPPLIDSFRVGTPASRAVADRRTAWLRGPGGFLNQGLDRQEVGSMNCGGRKELNYRVPILGTINLLTLYGGVIRLC